MNLKELKALAERATRGPYYICRGDNAADTYIVTGKPKKQGPFNYLNKQTKVIFQCFEADIGQAEINCEFLAALDPATILKLIQTIETMKEALQEISEQPTFGRDTALRRSLDDVCTVAREALKDDDEK